MTEFFASPYLWLFITAATFILGRRVHQKTGNHLLSPLIVSVLITGVCILATGTKYTTYQSAMAVSTLFLTPATICLAYPIYLQFDLLKKNALAIFAGTLVGAVTALTSVFVLCRLFGLDEILTASLLPKSVTSAIAIEVSASLGGIPSVTIVALMIAGLLGATTMPEFLRLCRIRDPIATGLAIGTASHALGTTRALQLGELESAMSGLAVAFTGIFTVLLTLFL